MDREKIVELYNKALGKSKLSEETWEKIAKVNQKVLDIKTGEISDGYHTFDELYEHRITLFIAFCKTLSDITYYNCDVPDRLKPEIWRSYHHSDGSNFEGWFVLGIGKEKGKQITYHLPITTGKGSNLCSVWEQCSFAEMLDFAPEFDGHTSEDVLERLKQL